MKNLRLVCFLKNMAVRMVDPIRPMPGNSAGGGPVRNGCISSDEWFRSLGGDERAKSPRHELFPSEPISRKRPVHADPEIDPLFEKMLMGRIKAGYIQEIAGGRYWGRGYGYILTPQDQILQDLSPTLYDFHGGADPRRFHDGLRFAYLPALTEVRGTVAVLNTLFAENFHHFLLDALPKCALLELAGLDLRDIDRFILVEPRAPYHRDALARLGIPREKIIISNREMHIRAERLIVPAYTEPGRQPELYNYSPAGLQFVRKLFLENNPSLKKGNWPAKIVVSREKAASRRLIDGHSIHPALERLGFQKILLEDHPLTEQAAIFHSATTVIMPTGGGLANCAFCQPGTRVIELFSPAYMPTFMLPLSSALGLEYSALVGARTGKTSGHSDLGSVEDIAVSKEQIFELVA